MSEKQISNAIMEAYKVCSRFSTQDDTIGVKGTTGDGLTIIMWVNTTTNTIVNAYPAAP